MLNGEDQDLLGLLHAARNLRDLFLASGAPSSLDNLRNAAKRVVM